MATDTNRTGLAYLAESTWGTTPGSALTDLRFTGESLAYNIAFTQSTEIRSDRQVTDVIQTGSDCAGGFNFELSYADYDVFMTAALWSSGWSTAATISGAIRANTAGTFSLTTGLNFSSITTGQWIKVAGFSGATGTSNNTYYRVTSMTQSTLTVVPLPGITTTATADTVTVAGSYIRNGVTESSFTFERSHSDAIQYFDFLGMVCNTFNLTATADSILTGSMEFIGKSATLGQTTGGTGSNNAAGTNPVINASSNVGRIYEGAFASLATKDTDLYIQEISFSLNNNVRALRAISSLSAVDIGVGTSEITGTLNAYFLDETLYDKYLAGTATGLSFTVTDSSGSTYIFTFPAIKFESDALNSGGQNADVMENIGWRAYRHAGTNCQVQIDKFS